MQYDDIVKRHNRKAAQLRVIQILMPWIVAVSFVVSYGFMAWMGKP
jgi:nitrate reductase NapE component